MPLPSPLSKLTDEALASHIRDCNEDIIHAVAELKSRGWVIVRSVKQEAYDREHRKSAGSHYMGFDPVYSFQDYEYVIKKNVMHTL